MRYVFASFMLAATLSACSIQKMAANSTVGILAIGAQAFLTEDDYEIAGDAFPANLKTMEALGVLADSNPQLMEILAQSYCSYSFGWLEPNIIRDTRSAFDESKSASVDRAFKLFVRGKNYGIKGLEMRHPGFAEALTHYPSLQEVLPDLDEDDVPLLAWTTFCWGSALKYKLEEDMVLAVGDLPFLRALLERSIELDGTFNYGVAYTILGSLEATVPASFGGRPDQAAALFNKAIDMADRKYLTNQVTFAEYFGQHQADEKVFDEMIQEVLDAPEGLFPEEALANRIAKERASALKVRRADYF